MAQAQPAGDAVPSTIGPYTVLRPLGAGAMGRVLLGEDHNGDKAAVKVLQTDNAERWRFVREAGLLRGDFGDTVARVLEADLDTTVPWIAIEYIPGHNLKERISQRGALTGGAAAALGMRLAGGLAELHRNGIAHRDLKPANVMIRENGDPVLIDFGLAVDTDGSGSGDRTDSRVVVGTADWMAPEYARGDRSDFLAADVYSLGAVLTYAATGIHPRRTSEFLAMHGIEAELSSALRALLDHDPIARRTADQAARRFAFICGHSRTLGDAVAEMASELSGDHPRAAPGRRVSPSKDNAAIAADRLHALYSKTKDLA